MAQARRINSVKELNGSTGCGGLINVKLCKLWDRHHFKTWDRVESREMLLMDSNSDRIVAGVHRDYFHRFNEKLIEGTSLLISNIGCAKNRERFKQCKHVFRIKYDERTTIELGPYVDTTNFGGIHGFDFVSFNYINATKDLSKLVDVIGQIKTTSGLTMKMARGRNQHHMELHIMNESAEILKCTLWGDHALKVQNHIDATGSIRAIVIISNIEDDNSITNLDASDVLISRSVSSNMPKVTGSSSVATEYDQDDEPITPVNSIQKRKVVEIDIDDQEHQASTNKKHSVSSNIPKVTGSSSVGTEYDQDDDPITPVSSIQKRKVVETDIDDQEHQVSTNKKHV
ncbi:OLC1v1036256C1 [Oldenlandia corymbosa var. corymbosa]|uniref:OLC1v1036256C1 n=1 Tax=Oldenlandia corymbosa var. corymbosa TaxID=529605 RepID=A0AAV1CUY4_OLDCO|nr:OLC1v1036256C1 [Oldenlandia corymbosa var. corymbosa]